MHSTTANMSKIDCSDNHLSHSVSHCLFKLSANWQQMTKVVFDAERRLIVVWFVGVIVLTQVANRLSVVG